MAETEKGQPDEPIENPAPAAARRGLFTLRNLAVFAGLLIFGLLLCVVAGLIFVKAGFAESYVKDQLTAKLKESGVAFDSEAFQLSLLPTELSLKNTNFYDIVSGEKLLHIDNAHLGLTVQDLFAWQMTRDISLDSTDVIGAELWVKFDENGKSNFANLKLPPASQDGSVNFKFQSVKFSLRDSTVHFGDVSHKISADAANVAILLEPENYSVADDDKRYKFDITSTDSKFIYDEKPLSPISVKAGGVADRNGADITNFRLTTPIGESILSGKLTDWQTLTYALNIESSVDLTQTSNIFALGTALRGVGNFKGLVTGEGAKYKVVGNVDSESLAAAGVFLKGTNIAATVEGTNADYVANGTAVAELLTFEDFRVEFPKIAGNVRGTGTDFRWVGELQAIAAKSKALTLGGLFISDAVAEMKDRELVATAGYGRTQLFAVNDNEFEDLSVQNLKFSTAGGGINLSAPGAAAKSFTTKDYQLNGIKGGNITVKNKTGDTDIKVAGLTANEALVKGTKLRNVAADDFVFSDRPHSIGLSAKNLRATELTAQDTKITGIEAPEIALTDANGETIVYSDKTRIAKIVAGDVTLGSLNIAGVRLTIKQGRVEVKSADIDAGTVNIAKSKSLDGGGELADVKIAKPIFVVERSGRYRATADMSIGGGIIGNIPLGNATAKVDLNNDKVDLTELTAKIMDGNVAGNASIAFGTRGQSKIYANFVDLDLSKIAALQGGRIIPIEGKTSGNVDLSLNGTDFATTSGIINATIAANAGGATNGTVPITGDVRLSATNGLFVVDRAELNSDKSSLTASGRFDLRNDDSNLGVSLESSDASEIERLIRVLGISPTLETQYDSMKAQVAGNLAFDGNVSGSLWNPTIAGKASLASISLRGRNLGSLASDIFISPFGTEIKNGILKESDGGQVAFSVNIPNGGVNNISVLAALTDVNAGNLLAALPIELPERLRDFDGKTSGNVDIKGLPNESQGEINIASAQGTVANKRFDKLDLKAVFVGSRVNLESGELRADGGVLAAKGFYDFSSTLFDLNVTGKSLPLTLALSFIPENPSLPSFAGTTDFTATATGQTNLKSTIAVNFDGAAEDVVINEKEFGQIAFAGKTINQILNADLTATLATRAQIVKATLNFGDANMPFNVRTDFTESPLDPFFALVPQLKDLAVGGSGTGQIEFGGNLNQIDANGNSVLTTDNLSGEAHFSKLALNLKDTQLVATEPVIIKLTTREIVFENAKFAGSDSNLTVSGAKAVTENGVNSLAVDGRINLSVLNVLPQLSKGDVFFAGFADVSMKLSGINKTSRVSGTANLDNAAIATFIGTDRLTFSRLQGLVRFTANQVQIEKATGYLGGGQFFASGGALLNDNLRLSQFRLGLNGTNITVPLPEDFTTTGDAKLEISGRSVGDNLAILISGNILARRSLYSTDIDLGRIVSSRSQSSLSGGSSSLIAPRFDLTIEGRDALIIKNNIADLTASASLRLTGNTNNPQLSGRITANSGTVFFRKDRYIVQRAVLEFPPNTNIDPIINLQAESEIGGYQVFVNLSGPLTDTDQLNASVRSSPALPQSDVVSLITTGSLSNTEGGIPTLAQTGINTAAEILTDSIINNPARKATDKLFGLNVFEIDPIISGERLNPSARLTVGRQINNNLRVTYATNLSQDQNQVLALEYRISNKLSLVAQYENKALSNVTQNRNNFGFEVRFRKRF